MKQKAMLLAAALLAVALAAAPLALAAPEQPVLNVGAPIAWPEPATSADTTVLANDSIVKVPDAKLKAALISATKLAAGKQLRMSDLAKLAGGLDLSNKGIANADGLQYCVNVTAINLTNNKLTGLPAKFKDLTKLETLSLADNRLAKFPEVLGSLPALTTLSLRGNQLDKLPTTLNVQLSQVKYLDVSDNKLSTIPTVIGKLSALETLYWADNGVKTAAADVFKMAKLVNLDLSGNLLEELPKEAATAPVLANLDVSANLLGELPTGIGAAPALVKLYCRSNRLVAIEPSLCTGKVKTLLLGINRIAKLPEELSAKTFDRIDVEWNYLDMAEGSADRKIMESVTAAGGSAYLHQLAQLQVKASDITRTTIHLQWQPVPDGSEGESTWTVSKYYVYDANNQTTWKKYAELDSMAGQYVVTGLDMGKDMRLMVGVEYDLQLPDFEGSTRNFTEVNVTTLEKDDPTPAAEATATVRPTDPGPATPTPTDAITVDKGEDTQATAGSSGGMMAALIIVSLVAIGAIASLVYLVLKQRRRNQYKY